MPILCYCWCANFGLRSMFYFHPSLKTKHGHKRLSSMVSFLSFSCLKIGAGLVIGTFLYAPIMFIFAGMATLVHVNPQHYDGTLDRTAVYLSWASLLCCVGFFFFYFTRVHDQKMTFCRNSTLISRIGGNVGGGRSGGICIGVALSKSYILLCSAMFRDHRFFL